MKKLVDRLRRRQDEGATAVEYGLLIALIAVVLAAGAFVLGTQINNKLNEVGNCVDTAGQTGETCN
jgi:pilus assembly protein Flp/PilA